MTAADFTALRLALGLTQAQMGARVGLSQAQVSRIESGERGITPMLEKLLNKETPHHERHDRLEARPGIPHV